MNGTRGKFPTCNNDNCFANNEGRCNCLSDSDFGGRKCPFFKTKKEFERGRLLYPVPIFKGE